VLKAADRHVHAAEAYKAALQLQPDHPTAHYKLASVLKQLGKHKAAAHHYRCECIMQEVQQPQHLLTFHVLLV
jgi:Tfp pilus assembly protein PilF